MTFLDYLKHKRITITAFLTFAVIICACQLFFGMPLKILWYPYALCVLIGLGFLIAGYRRQRKTCAELRLIAGLQAELIDDLPEPLSPEAAGYQKIIRSLCTEDLQRQAGLSRRYDDMIDYYTAWAHQIKTPIAAMKLSFQNEDSVLARQSLNDLKRIERYVDMVLTYLKLDSGDIDLVIREHDLDDIIRPVIRNFAGEFINRKIRLEYDPAGYTVLTDDKWLAFVLEQLLSNALKYTKEGTIRIYMEPSSLCISDTGIGIDAADLPRIFEKGFTGYNGRSDKRASGIGLYLCKRICDRLGHPISAESAVGAGTTLRIGLKRDALGIE